MNPGGGLTCIGLHLHDAMGEGRRLRRLVVILIGVDIFRRKDRNAQGS
jgi:hypothetical protein